MPNQKLINVTLNLPYIGEINGEWEPSEIEKEASWEMYISLITHTSFLKTMHEDVLILNSISAVHSIFISINTILIKYGLSIHQPKGKNQLTFGYIAILILNHALRPFVEKWRYILLKHEKNSVDNFDCKIPKIKNDLKNMTETINEFTSLLSKVVYVPSVIVTNLLD